jgi:hypothetical protein
MPESDRPDVPDDQGPPVDTRPGPDGSPFPSLSAGLGSGRGRRAPRPGSRAGGTVARVPIVLAVVALLAVGGLVDRAGGHRSVIAAPPLAAADSVAAPAAALSSSWFCGGATDASGGQAPGQLLVTNAGPRPLDGSVTLVPSAGKSVVESVHVGAAGQTVVPETVPGGAPWIGAFVDLEGGQASVEQQITSSIGSSSTPCATTGSRSWYFTSGATLINEDDELTLLNPYPTDAIADLTFSTDEGVEQTNDFQGLDVPARGMLIVDIGSHLRRRQRIATTVSVRSGRVVAWKTDIVTPPSAGEATIGSAAAATAPDPAAPIGGVTDTLGSPSTGTEWTWPEGVSGNGLDERYTIYNPGAATAQVALGVGLDAGTAQPFDLTVGPESVVTVVSSGQARIPAGVGHFAVLRSTNGVPVVAERTLAAGAPSTLTGLGELPGLRVAGTSWLLGSGALASGTQEYVVVQNPGATVATVQVVGLSGRAVAGLGAVRVPAGGRTSIELSRYAPADPAVEVRSSTPVVVERDLYGPATGPGVSLSPGVPLAP